MIKTTPFSKFSSISFHSSWRVVNLPLAAIWPKNMQIRHLKKAKFSKPVNDSSIKPNIAANLVIFYEL
jgi:hypothetical protein